MKRVYQRQRKLVCQLHGLVVLDRDEAMRQTRKGLDGVGQLGFAGGTRESSEMDHTLLQSCGSHLHSDGWTTLQCSKCVRNAYVVCAAPGRMPDFRMQSQDHSSSLISVTYIISSLSSHILLSSLTSLFSSFLLFPPLLSSSLVSLYSFILFYFQYIAYHHSNKIYHFRFRKYSF